MHKGTLIPKITVGFLPRVIQALYDHGADINLTDIEGNTPRDLAEKNGHNKCAKYILASMRQNAPESGVNGSIVVRLNVNGSS